MPLRRIPALAVAALFALSVAVTASAQSTQQTRMRQCNVEANAKHLLGRSRQDFMRTCLSGPAGRHRALNAQQRRMKSCSAEARRKGLKGAAHKRYMKSCLKSG